MDSYIWLILGIITMIIFIKIILPSPKVEKIYPTLENYNNITYIDENGLLYKYDLVKVP